MDEDGKKVVAAHWSAECTLPVRTRWWQSAFIVGCINERIGGLRSAGTQGGDIDLLRKLAGSERFERAVSVGCGTAFHELKLLQAGVVGHFDLFELAEERVAQIRAAAAEAGLTPRINVTCGDPLEHAPVPAYDLVYWKDALHHMTSAFDAVNWSHGALLAGGLFFMNDFIGPTRMQWTERQLDLAEQVRTLLPKRYLKNPHAPDKDLPLRRTRPTVDAMIASDPSECADSDNILPSLIARFPGLTVIPTGGIVYMLALNDVLANTDDTTDDALLSVLMGIDSMHADRGDSLYAVAYARK